MKWSGRDQRKVFRFCGYEQSSLEKQYPLLWRRHDSSASCSRPFNSGKLLIDNCKSLVGAADARVHPRKHCLECG
jgi:hypothetical protein